MSGESEADFGSGTGKSKSQQALWARLLIGVFGGYIVANLTANALLDIAPLPRGEAVFTALLSIFLLETVLLLYAFGASSIGKVVRNFAVLGILSLAISFFVRTLFPALS